MENNLFTIGVLEGDCFVSLISGKKSKVVNAVKEPEGIKINAPMPDLGQVEVQRPTELLNQLSFGKNCKVDQRV